MRIRWIGQNGYIIRTERTEIIIDPYLSNAVEARPRLVEAPIRAGDIRADAVICTHDHLDHLDPVSIPQMPSDTLFITTGEGREKILSLGQKNVTALNEGESITVGDITVTAVFAVHQVEAMGLIIAAEGKTLYFSGDTLFDKRLYDIKKYAPDHTFICINGRLGNMNVTEALDAAAKIGARVNIPCHYGMFASNTEDPHKFAAHISGGRILEFNVEYMI